MLCIQNFRRQKYGKYIKQNIQNSRRSPNELRRLSLSFVMLHRHLLMHHACLAFSAVHCHAHDSKSLGCGNGAVAVEVSMCELACGESDGTHCAAHCEQCVGNGYDAVAVTVAV